MDFEFEVVHVTYCKRKIKKRNKRKYIDYIDVVFSKEFREFCENIKEINFKESLKRKKCLKILKESYT